MKFGLHGSELTIVLFTTLVMPLLTLLLIIFIVYRFWHWLKQRDKDKRAAARSRFSVDAADDLNNQASRESNGASARDGVDAESVGAAGASGVDGDARSKVRNERLTGEEPLAAPVEPVAPDAAPVSAPAALLARIASHSADEALAARGLSERERTVLQGVCDEKTFAALAEELGVSRSTVGTYCTRAYEKLGVSSKEDAKAELARLTRCGLLAAAGLSERETEVAVLAADGTATSDIAATLVVSEATVSSHLQQAYAKLGVHSRTELMTLLGASATA